MRQGLIMKNPEIRKLYWVWSDMKSRCSNPKHKAYPRYGARGITVCDEWQDFAGFLSDMWPRPRGKSLDRINNDKGYSAENCRWATRAVQNLNKRVYAANRFGISGVELRSSGYFRVRVRFQGRIVTDKSVSDFFEACCIRKTAELKYHKPILEKAA